MRGKALTLALLLFASALAGCIGEGSEEPDDRTSDDIDVNDVTDVTEQLDLESCEDAGGTWIEVRDRPIDGYCVQGGDEDDRENEQEITQEDCEERGYNWTEAPDREDEYYCDFEVEENREITQEDCERRNGTWIETPERPIDGYCDFGEDDDRGDEQEITQEDCEQRGFNWTEAPDREGVFYWDFGEQDREDREITQEDCERRNGTWTEAPDRPDEFYCEFDENDGNSTTNSNPVITIVGDSELQLNASDTEEYVDAGATCHDEEDGDLTNVTTVSGQLVDMGNPGTYEIIYICEDSDGNSVQISRFVTILEVDTDGDGVGDDDDAFPNDANETTDSDGDGGGDNADQCDETESGATIGDDGCVVGEAQEHFIDISGMAFSESTITISIGDLITWTNQDSAPHSATADNGEFDSGTLNNGDTFPFIFNTAGPYTYPCAIHNGMTATIIVE